MRSSGGVVVAIIGEGPVDVERWFQHDLRHLRPISLSSVDESRFAGTARAVDKAGKFISVMVALLQGV